MDKKAIAEVRQILGGRKCVIDRIGGCFAGEDGEIILDLDETFLALQEEEQARYCELFRKTLSGKTGRNLFNLEFPLKEEEEGGKQAVMYRLLKSGLEDRSLIHEFCAAILGSLDDAGHHLILLAHGNYDIPKRTSDGMELEDASDYVYSFLVCCICPVAEVKEGLCFDALNQTFVNKAGDLGVQMPMLGFLFPAFNDREPDIHSILYYSKKEDERHPELMDAIVGSDLPITEKAQKELFSDLVEQTLGRDCTFDNVMSVTDSINQMAKQDENNPGAMELGRTEVSRILQQTGADPRVLDHFDEKFEEAVGEGGSFTAENLARPSAMQIKAPSVSISVKSEMADMITTRIIDGREYILIPLQPDTELNGIRILSDRLSNPALGEDSPGKSSDARMRAEDSSGRSSAEEMGTARQSSGGDAGGIPVSRVIYNS